MTTRFDRELTGFRFAETHYGDTLQDVSLRELGDASRWVELISYNNLVPPFIVDDPALARTGVLLSGGRIIVPAPGRRADQIDADAVLGSDVQLSVQGDLMTDGFDFSVVAGQHNMSQALRNRVSSERGDLMYHPDYGNDVRRLIGKVNGPTKGLLAARVTRTCVLQDPRVVQVSRSGARAIADAIIVAVECETISGRQVSAIAGI
jgi:phage baseplate assembly protein W